MWTGAQHALFTEDVLSCGLRSSIAYVLPFPTSPKNTFFTAYKSHVSKKGCIALIKKNKTANDFLPGYTISILFRHSVIVILFPKTS